MRSLIAVMMFAVAASWLPLSVSAQPQTEQQEAKANAQQQAAEERVESLNEPLYNPFVERYVLDELKQLRSDMAAQRVNLTEQFVDRQINVADKAISYATDTVTYFFYLIAGVSSLLVLVGWTSIRDIKEKVHGLANEEITKLVSQYEERLRGIEEQLSEKTRHIEHNRDEIELTKEIQSLWLRAGREHTAAGKIAIYDQILTLRAHDGEALTYKADAVLELGEPQWAIHLCQRALEVDPENGNAYYQLACAHASQEHWEEAVEYLSKALDISAAYRDEAMEDEALDALHEYPPFARLMGIGPTGMEESSSENAEQPQAS
ncbi:tetratricopeptide repeat protein [Microbulbifer guangxiensis]|uniref:tetratricopeptide repeat protein n=1 Tax=Microbulbifer guangxiensis TaxID=2904249 RepID=UPI001F3F9E14|nr:tetratricopeptide repeat protein [Microbulbifer guangxiensis]